MGTDEDVKTAIGKLKPDSLIFIKGNLIGYLDNLNTRISEIEKKLPLMSKVDYDNATMLLEGLKYSHDVFCIKFKNM